MLVLTDPFMEIRSVEVVPSFIVVAFATKLDPVWITLPLTVPVANTLLVDTDVPFTTEKTVVFPAARSKALILPTTPAPPATVTAPVVVLVLAVVPETAIFAAARVFVILSNVRSASPAGLPESLN